MCDIHSGEALLFGCVQQPRQGFDADAELRQINQLIGAEDACRAGFTFVEVWRARSLNACADQTDLHRFAKAFFHTTDSMRLMAIIACVAGVGFAVAIHAAFHRKGLLFPERVAFSDRAVTALTFRARFQMYAVTEPDPVWKLINPRPWDGGFVLMIFGEFLDRG